MNVAMVDEAAASNERIAVEFLERALDGAAAEFGERAIGTADDGAVTQSYGRVMELRQVRQAVRTLARGVVPDAAEPLYLVGSSFLMGAYNALTETSDEHLVYATGPEDGKRAFAISQLVTFELAEKSAVSAAPDPTSQLEALTELDRRGERLLAVLHSHPGRGAGATTPSSVDRSTQEGLEKMGYPTIGVIFSRDGFVRFFSVNRKFRVAVSGTGIEPAGDHIYRLSDVASKSFLQRVVSHGSRS